MSNSQDAWLTHSLTAGCSALVLAGVQGEARLLPSGPVRVVSRSSLVAAAVLISLFWHVQKAVACSPLEAPSTHADLGATAPSDGDTDVPLDVSIGVQFTPHEAGGYPRTPALSLVDLESGEAVQGEVISSVWDGWDARFRPTQPLLPNRSYAFIVDPQADAQGGASAPAEPEDWDGGVPTLVNLMATFTTGRSRLSSLEAVGSLQVRLEPEERSDYSSCSSECDCEPDSTVSGTRAVVTLPGVTGGQGDFGYRLLVMVTAEVPFDFSLNAENDLVYTNAWAVVGATAGTELTIGRLDATAADYAPCFAIQTMDMAGKELIMESVCLDERVPATTPGGEGRSTSGGGANQTASEAEAEDATSDKATASSIDAGQEEEDATSDKKSEFSNDVRQQGVASEEASGCSVGSHLSRFTLSLNGFGWSLFASLGLLIIGRARLAHRRY